MEMFLLKNIVFKILLHDLSYIQYCMNQWHSLDFGSGRGVKIVPPGLYG